ncbi:hypothetical protein [Lutispora thermophila]|uniref:Uncharacterized protein n=1 Tax=Lutispora thermophila DSM 19022 TaxID=1122184 RepID=A0A1M6IPH1_9FIRM|nr:hypothetical protein [Lutispora thermophila]SHJ36361.1 hypothetical protein SAMN02745176_03347 [Lutispora thermophila DSM 19022]
MAKTLGNISYSDIVKNRDKVVRREGINKDIFAKLMQRINICGFENDDGNITAYFNSDDLEVFDAIVSNSDKYNDFNMVADRLDRVDEKLKCIYEALSIDDSGKGLNEEIRTINERLEALTEYVSEYYRIINEIKDSNFNNSKSSSSVIEVDGCGKRMDELLDRFDGLYGDMVRNMAYLRNDLKIKIGQKSVSKWKKAFFIYLFGALSAAAILIMFEKYIPGWFL